MENLTNLRQVDSSIPTLWISQFPAEGVAGYFLLLPCLIEIHVLNANSVDPDQTLLSTLFAIVHLWDGRHKVILNIKYTE